jgi:hypothetical protein
MRSPRSLKRPASVAAVAKFEGQTVPYGREVGGLPNPLSMKCHTIDDVDTGGNLALLIRRDCHLPAIA